MFQLWNFPVEVIGPETASIWFRNMQCIVGYVHINSQIKRVVNVGPHYFVGGRIQSVKPPISSLLHGGSLPVEGMEGSTTANGSKSKCIENG